MNKTIYLMSGVQGSGKSHWAIEQAAESEMAVYVSRDDVRFFLLEPKDRYFDKEKQVWQIFVETINQYIRSDSINPIYVDSTLLTDSSRRKLIRQLDIDETDELKLVIMDTTLETCLKRNEKRKGLRKVPDDVIINAWEKFQRYTNIERINETIVIKGEC